MSKPHTHPPLPAGHYPTVTTHRSLLTNNSLLGPLLSLVALLLYTRTMAPSLGGTVDSAEFQQTTYSLGMAHPTGYPLYLLLGRLWITIFPFGDPAFKINLLSVLFGALSVWVLYETVRFLTRNTVAAAAGAALFAVQAIPWAQAGVAEINTLNNLLTGMAFLMLVRWSEGETTLPLAFLAYGLAASHHRTAILYAPLLALFVIFAIRRQKYRRVSLQGLLLSVLLLVLPFTAYFYPFIETQARRIDLNNWGGFWGWALGESALPVIQGALNRPLLPRFISLLTEDVFWGWPGRALLALGLVGLGYCAWLTLDRLRKRAPHKVDAHSKAILQHPIPTPISNLNAPATLLYAVSALLGVIFATVYDILDVNDYLGVPILLWCVVAGVGIAIALHAWDRFLARGDLSSQALVISRLAAILGLLALCMFTGWRSFSRLDIRVDYSHLDRRAYWADVQAKACDLPQGAILIGDWPEYNEALYFQRVEAWRPDLSVHVLDNLLAGGLVQVQRWLDEKRPMYLLGAHYEVLSQYSTEQLGPIWRILGKKEASPPPALAHKLNRRYGDNILLLGYTLEPATPVSAGGVVNLTLYWQATNHINERFVVFNHIIDAQGGKVGQKDDEPNRGFTPTVYWNPGQQVIDQYTIEIKAGTPSGPYRLMTGLYSRIGERRLPAYSSQDESLGDYPELAEITVK